MDGVRIIRDSSTGINKGFSYIRFKDRSGVMFACKQNGKIELDSRKLRVFRCHSDKVKGQTKFGGSKSQPGRGGGRAVRSVQPVVAKKKRKFEKRGKERSRNMNDGKQKKWKKPRHV